MLIITCATPESHTMVSSILTGSAQKLLILNLNRMIRVVITELNGCCRDLIIVVLVTRIRHLVMVVVT